MNEPALLELFNCLREAGLPLGLAEYNLLLQAISGGFGTSDKLKHACSDRDALAQLCRVLWVKSQQEEQIFQDYFDQIIPQQPEQEVFLQSETEKPNLTDTGSTTNQKERAIIRRYKAAGVPRFLLLGFTTCVVAIGFAFLFFERIPPIDGSKPVILEFSSNSSVFNYPNDETKAWIKITRSGGIHGTVRAKLKISAESKNGEKKCLPEKLKNTLKVRDGLQVSVSSPQVVFTEAGEKTFGVDIMIDDNKADFLYEYITLCLTDIQGEVKLGDRDETVLVIQNSKHLIKWLLIISTCIIYYLLVVRKMLGQTVSPRDDAIAPETYINLPKIMLSPEVIRTMADEIQVAQAIRQLGNQFSELFPLIVNDLPITHRQMKQGWRYLRQFSREGAPSELDLQATIQQVAQQGILLNPVLVPRRTNKVELLLLIDRDGSMVPFHHLSQELVDTAFRGGHFSRVRVYYFHNYPDEYLYRDPFHLDPEPIDDCLLNLAKGRTVCLIFSDAGAARGRFSSRRRRLTKFFLKNLRQYVRYTVWLNPVPRNRWETTTAHDIAALVPMFEVNRQEFYMAIDVLRGHHKPWGLM